MANLLMVAGRIFCIISILILTVLLWKNMVYFDRLSDTDRIKALIAGDILVIFLTLISLVVRMILL